MVKLLGAPFFASFIPPTLPAKELVRQITAVVSRTPQPVDGIAPPSVKTLAPTTWLKLPMTGGAINSPSDRLNANEKTMLTLFFSLGLPEGKTKADLNNFLHEHSSRPRQYPEWLTGAALTRVETYFAGIDAPLGKTLSQASNTELLAEADHQRRQISMIVKGVSCGSAYSTEMRFARVQDLADELERRANDASLPAATRYQLAGEAGLALLTLAYEASERSQNRESLVPAAWTMQAIGFRDRAAALAAECTRISDSGAFAGASALPRGYFWKDMRAASGPYESMLERLVSSYDLSAAR